MRFPAGRECVARILAHDCPAALFASTPTWGIPGRTLAVGMRTEHISFESPYPSVLDADGRKRIVDFLARHGGPARDVEHEADRLAGESGWSEVHAADGYRLRCEWSVFGPEERQMNFVEIAPVPGDGGNAD
jgi:hypothetical protein